MRAAPRRSRLRTRLHPIDPSTSTLTFEVDLIELMLDLDPGMLDRAWLEELPG